MNNFTISKNTINILAVSKPPGLPTTYKNSTDNSDCLVKRVIAKYPELLNVNGFKPKEGGLLYRLDNATSGLIIFAKTQKMFDSLIDKQEKKQLYKNYYAVSESDKKLCEIKKGLNEYKKVTTNLNNPVARILPDEYFHMIEPFSEIPNNYFNIDIPIGHSKKSSKRMLAKLNSMYKVKGEPYHSETFIRILGQLGNLFLVEALIQKAIRHQIRVHLDAIGLPIKGDQLYNNYTTRNSKMFLYCSGIYHI